MRAEHEKRTGSGTPPRVLFVTGGTYTKSIVCQLAHHFNQRTNYRFSVLATGQSEGRPGECPWNEVFESVSEFPVPETRPKGVMRKLAFFRELVNAASAIRTQESVLGRSIRGRVYERLLYNLLADRIPSLFAAHDLVLWQSLSSSVHLDALQCAPPASKIVVSIWGSDLMRTEGVETYQRQLMACQKAARITVCTLEMRELFLTKFGRSLSHKMRIALFGSDMFARIDSVNGQRDNFLSRFQLPLDKINVCIGNNGSRDNNHVGILQAISQMSDEQTRRMSLIIPMTYGADAEFIGAIRQIGRRLPCPMRIINHPLAPEDVARLRTCVDVYLHFPTTDAFSATMTETLYAGGILVTGAWLPYGLLRRRGIHYHDIERLEQLPMKLTWILDHFEDDKRRTIQTGKAARQLADWERVIDQWIDICDELLTEDETGKRAN